MNRPLSIFPPTVTAVSAVLFAAVICTAGICSPDSAIAQPEDAARLRARLDSIASAYATDSTVAGLSVTVSRRGDMLLREGYGQADLELDVPTPTGAVYPIGSLTKQFTAAAILQLAENGAVRLDAPVTRYLPDYDTRGHTITVRHLLHHTSGIPDWGRMPEARRFRRQSFSHDLVIDTVLATAEEKPLRFEPGTDMSYSNTGYFLLGAIIEEVSGTRYRAFLEKHLLGPNRLDETYYCDERAVVDRRAHGYAWSETEGFRHKQFVEYAWPFAAGGLCSTAQDLVAWTEALHGGDVLSDSMYREMVTPGRLSDGTRLGYAMGLVVGEESGRRLLRHGGGTFGFLSEARYYPDEGLTVVVLQNSTGLRDPSVLAERLASRTQKAKGPYTDSSS